MVKKTPNVLQVINHPELLSWGRDSIHHFLKGRARYELLIDEANNNSESKLQKTSIKASFDPDLIESLIFMQKFGSGVTLSSLSDEKIIEVLKKEQKEDDCLTSEELLKTIKSQVSCNMKEKDPSLRVELMVSNYLTCLRRLQMLDLVTDSPKLAIEHLVELIKPAGLQELLISDRDFKHRSLRKNFLGFAEHMKERAKNFETYNMTSNATSGKGGGSGGGVSGRGDFSGGNSGGGVSGSDGSSNGNSSSGGSGSGNSGTGNSGGGSSNAGISDSTSREGERHNSQEPDSKTSRGTGEAGKEGQKSQGDKRKPKCLNSKCNGERHYMDQCPKSSEEEKRDLLQEYKDSKTSNEGNGLNSLHASGPISVIQDTSAAVKFSFGTEKVYDALADTGADHSAIDRASVKELQKDGAFVGITKLKKPLSLQLALDFDSEGNVTKRQEFLVTEAARLTPVISLPQGPLALRNVLHVIAEQPLNRILLGRPELDEMEFMLTAISLLYAENTTKATSRQLIARCWPQ